MKYIPEKVTEPLERLLLACTNYKDRKELMNHDFSIISNNCWGGQVYKNLGKPYNTPFVGLFLHAPCYMKLLENLKYYLTTPLLFTKTSKYLETFNYPVGLLHDIEIHFLHYDDEAEAADKWSRRLGRFNWNNMFVKFSDRDLATVEHAKQFDQLPYPQKVFFSSRPIPHIKSLVWFTEFENSPSVDHEMKVYKKYFDAVQWLNRTQR